MVREHNLYFAGLSPGDSIRLLLGAAFVLCFGNTGYGKAARSLERQFAHRFGGDDAVAFPSARVGISSLLRALDIGRGDEVLVTGYTCTAVPTAIISAGAIPVYVDIDPDNFAMDPARAKALLNPRTRAILMQHTFGIPARTKELSELAEKCGLVLLEDAALSIGSATDERLLGAFGAASVFSFELSKTMTAGWGGMVVTRFPGIGDRLRRIRGEFGRMGRVAAARRLFQVGASGLLYRPGFFRFSKYVIAVLFRLGIFRPSASDTERSACLSANSMMAPADLHWRIVERQLDRLSETTSRAAAIASRYSEIFRAHGWTGGRLSAFVRLCRFPVLVASPDLWVRHFANNGFEIGRWFDAPVSPAPDDPSVFHFDPDSCPTASLLARHIVNFPLHKRLTDTDVERLCGLIEALLSSLPPNARFMRPARPDNWTPTNPA